MAGSPTIPETSPSGEEPPEGTHKQNRRANEPKWTARTRPGPSTSAGQKPMRQPDRTISCPSSVTTRTEYCASCPFGPLTVWLR